jgi:uncharacterized protein
MKIRVQDVSETPEEVEFGEDASELNPMLQSGVIRDFECSGPLRVVLTHYRAGRDLFFDGEIEAPMTGRCARCTEVYPFSAGAAFHFLMTPRDEGDEAAGGEDIDVSLYDGDEVDLAPLVRERILLSLPTTPLCDEKCRGLCPRCGINLNLEQCTCPASDGDPRMAVFRSLRVDR